MTTSPDPSPRRDLVAALAPTLQLAADLLKDQERRAHLARQAWERLTPDEQRARLQARRAANLARRDQAITAHAELLDRGRGVERELLELHGPVDNGWGVVECQGCEFQGYDAEPPEWPCQTYATLARAAGATITTAGGIIRLDVPDRPPLPPPPAVTDSLGSHG